MSQILKGFYAKHRNDFTIFQNLDHGLTGGHEAVHTFLSGVKSVDAKNMPEGNTIQRQVHLSRNNM